MLLQNSLPRRQRFRPGTGKDAREAGFGLSGLIGRIAGDVIQTTPGKHVEKAGRLVLLHQLRQQPGEQAMFVQIGAIAGVKAVLVAEQGNLCGRVVPRSGCLKQNSARGKTGRESCRESVCKDVENLGGAESLKKK